MSVNRKFHSENLYLCKEEHQEIYVAVSQLLQHQIDGIRFLYTQFKKKRRGVILNDPSGYGKTLQIVLFLSAIHYTLKKPVLIICNEDNLKNWIEHFQKWTELSSDIVIKSPRPPSKNIYITLITDFVAFTRRDWSVLVIDDDAFSKKMLQNLSNITADHKICVTSLDMKNNLPIFSTIYQWLFPKEKFVIDDFIADTSNVKEVVEKSILLDSFFEDIVIRRMEYKDSPFGQKLQRDETSHKVTKETQKISRKNKDATGTKIKRSKRKTEDNEDTQLQVINRNTNKVAKTNCDHTVIAPIDIKDNEDTQLQIINRNTNKVAKTNYVHTLIAPIDIKDEDTKLQVVNRNTNKVAKTNYDHTVIAPIDVKDNEETRLRVTSKNTNEAAKSRYDNNVIVPTDITDNGETKSKVVDRNTNEVTKNNYDTVVLPTDIKDKSNLEFTTLHDNDINGVNTNEFENSIHNREPILSEGLKEFNCLEFTRETERTEPQPSQDSVDKNPEIDIIHKNKEEKSSVMTDFDKYVYKDEKGNESIVANSQSQTCSNVNDRNQINTEVQDKSSPCNQKDRSEAKNDTTSKIKSFDDKISLIEQNALRKFKGSLLDSIF